MVLCDDLLDPTTLDTAFKLDELKDDPLQMYLTDIYTVGAPLAGLPAISVPHVGLICIKITRQNKQKKYVINLNILLDCYV